MAMVLAVFATLSSVQGLYDARAQDLRIAAIAYRLQTRAVGLCDVLVQQSGLIVHDLNEYSDGQRVDARNVFGFSGMPAVLGIVPGSAAERAGLRADDGIVSVDGKPLATAQEVSTSLERGIAAPPASVVILRDGVHLRVALTGLPGCASRVQVIPGRKRVARADGTYVQLTPAIIAEAKSDGELASIIAHEMAHNILRHRVWLDRVGRTTKNIAKAEQDADRLSVYILLHAAYDAEAPAQFWTHYGASTGLGILSDGTHMRTKARVVFLQAVAADAVAKQASGRPVVP